jgi:hypothetical protein
MRELSRFVKDKFTLNGLFEDSVHVNTIEEVDDIVSEVGCGNYMNIVFKNSSLKDYFLDSLYSVRPDMRIINCNCTVDRFNENEFHGLLVFNNVNKCGHHEIIEELKNHKGILIC